MLVFIYLQESFFLKNACIYLFTAELGLRCCEGFFVAAVSRGLCHYGAWALGHMGFSSGGRWAR